MCVSLSVCLCVSTPAYVSTWNEVYILFEASVVMVDEAMKRRKRRKRRGGWVGRRRKVYSSKAMNEVDAGRDRAMPASVRHDADEPLTPGGSRASPADGRGRRVAALEYSAMPCCRPADLPALGPWPKSWICTPKGRATPSALRASPQPCCWPKCAKIREPQSPRMYLVRSTRSQTLSLNRN